MSYYETERDNKIIAVLENIAKQLERINESICEVAKVPNADIVEVKHAKWEINSDGYYPYCSHCKTEPKNGVMSKRCPECGAKMDR